MADKETSNENEIDTSVDEVETPDDQEEDDSDNQGADEDSQDEDESGEDSEDDSDEDEDEDSDFQKAFSKIKGETPLEYIPNLEEAYRVSSEEGKRLSTLNNELQGRLDAINNIVDKNPELKKLIEDSTADGEISPVVDPALAMVRQEYQEKIQEDLKSFLGEHPELEDDEDLSAEFFANLDIVGAAARKKGKILRPLEGYKKAWAMMDNDDSKDKIVNAAKSIASKTKPKSSKKSISKDSGKKGFSDEQIALAKKMGLTEKQLIENSQ